MKVVTRPSRSALVPTRTKRPTATTENMIVKNRRGAPTTHSEPSSSANSTSAVPRSLPSTTSPVARTMPGTTGTTISWVLASRRSLLA